MMTVVKIGEMYPEVEAAAPRASLWVVELLLKSAHMVCLACPLCGRLNAEVCVLCQACLCPTHDLGHRVASDPICQSCWRDY
jgi:hypothetical protein